VLLSRGHEERRARTLSIRRIIVIGGGAAGLIAAGQAAEAGASVTLLERRSRAGRKLSITGKGRCNLTNTAELSDFITHYGPAGRFLHNAFSRFFSTDLVAFLGELGVETASERGGRVFPVGNDAVQIVAALTDWVKGLNVALRTDQRVKRLLVEQDHISAIETVGDRVYECDAVIVATGGASYPATGSTGDGYKLAESVGHTVIPIRTALVPLETASDIAPRLQGLSLRNAQATVLIDGKKEASLFGEMLFTHYGLSGPIILSLSKVVVDALSKKSKVTISIDLKPALDDQKLDARLLRDFQTQGRSQFKSVLKGLLPKTMIPVCLDLTGISQDKLTSQISSEERQRLLRWLKDLRLDVTGHRSFDEAIVTAGGVNLKEVDPKTMQSKIVKGLYFAGEVLDIDGETGGYNLQAAFSTGWVAGRSASMYLPNVKPT